MSHHGAYTVRTHLLILLLASAGCGAEPDHFLTKHGALVEFTFNGEHSISKESADAMEDWEIAHMQNFGYGPNDSAGAFSQVNARMVATPFKCSTEGGTCAGEQWDSILIVYDQECPWAGAYRHELTHWLQETHGITDYEHSLPEWKEVQKLVTCI